MGQWNCTAQIPAIPINHVVFADSFHPGVSNPSVPHKEAS